MCGIAGILKVWTPEQRELALRTPHGQSIPEAWLDILDDSIKHRGPDGQGRFRDRAVRADGCVVDVALVHRRLSIIDHAGGHQPMIWQRGTGILPVAEMQRYTARVAAQNWADAASCSTLVHGQDAHATDTVAVAFNGCIYNHRELRAELQRAGHVFNTDHSDTEVLVHGWREWGERMLPKLEGMFAVAIWDASRSTLLIARDYFGEKPIYWLDQVAPASAGIRAFASTAAALEQLCITARSTDAEGQPAISRVGSSDLDSLLRQGFGNVWQYDSARPRAVPASGCADLAQDDECPKAIFGRFTPRESTAAIPTAIAASGGGAGWLRDARTPPQHHLDEENTDRLLRRAVAKRVESDVPMGAFLSGGVDSSLVALFAKEAVGNLRTICVKMPDARYDESPVAARVAAILGTEHITVECDAKPSEDLERLIRQMGIPFGDSSLLPTYWASKAAARHMKVVLTGDGGDEMFAGYERYMAHFVLQKWSWAPGVLPPAIFPDRDPKAWSSKVRRLAVAAREGGAESLAWIFGDREIAVLHKPSSPARYLRMMNSFGWVLANGLPRLSQDMLCKVDGASMAAGIESRAPFLDSELAAAIFGADPMDLIPGRQRKGLLRQVARKYLPAEIVDRPKMGFAIPIGEWFRSDYGGLHTMLLDHLNSTEPFGPLSLGIDLNMKFIRQMLDEHLGTGPSGMVKRDHSQRLYMLLVLSIWAKWMGSLR